MDNVYHLSQAKGCRIREMYDVIERLRPEQRTRYGKGYSKSDFTALDEVYEEYKKDDE